MKAIVLHKTEGLEGLRLEDFPDPEPGIGEVVVKIKAAALNRRDVWMTRGLYPKIKTPVVPGSDGSGIVVKTGAGTNQGWTDKEVIIYPALNWGENPAVQSANFRVLGMPENGTQAEYIVIPEENLAEKPPHLSFEEAAALPLAGLTGYRALFVQGRLTAGQTVLITGVGGGVASMMLHMALATGARVLVTSGSENKIREAIKPGATGGANYTDEHWMDQIKEKAGKPGIDLIVDSAGGETLDSLIKLVNPGGRIVIYGATLIKPSTIKLQRVFWRQIAIQGTSMGTLQDFKEMLRLVENRQIHPVIDRVFRFEEYRAAYERMEEKQQFGKIILVP